MVKWGYILLPEEGFCPEGLIIASPIWSAGIREFSSPSWSWPSLWEERGNFVTLSSARLLLR